MLATKHDEVIEVDKETREALELHKKLHDSEIAAINQRLHDHATMIDDLRENDIRIMERLGNAATHEDIIAVNGKIDSAVNGLLRDALQAVPEHAANQIGRQSNVWLAIAAIAALCALVVAVVHG